MKIRKPSIYAVFERFELEFDSLIPCVPKALILQGFRDFLYASWQDYGKRIYAVIRHTN